jgi:hypothetical protein
MSKSATKEILDIKLTRYACYLVAQHRHHEHLCPAPISTLDQSKVLDAVAQTFPILIFRIALVVNLNEGYLSRRHFVEKNNSNPRVNTFSPEGFARKFPYLMEAVGIGAMAGNGNDSATLPLFRFPDFENGRYPIF